MWPRVLSVANNNVLALYLWHMLPVIVTLLGYPTGLLAQPQLGSGSWWLARLEWELVLAVVAVAVLSLLWWRRQSSRHRYRPLYGRYLVVLQKRCTTSGRRRVRSRSASPPAVSHPATGFPVTAAVLFCAGALLVAICPKERSAGRELTRPPSWVPPADEQSRR